MEDGFRADFLFGVVLLIAASNYIVCKQALLYVPPFTLLAVRYLLALSVVSLLIFSRRTHLSRELMIKSGLLGLVLALAVVSWQFGIKNVDHIGPAAFIVSLDGLMVPVFAYLLFGKALNAGVVLAIPVALTGLALLCLRKEMSVSSTDVWFVVSAIAFSLHILLTHYYGKSFDAICFSWGQMVVVCILTLVAAIRFEREDVTLANLELAKYLIVYLAIVATAFRLSLQNHVQRKISANRAGFLFVTEPILVALAGWLVLSESMTVQQMLGCVMIFLALIVSRGVRKKAEI